MNGPRPTSFRRIGLMMHAIAALMVNPAFAPSPLDNLRDAMPPMPKRAKAKPVERPTPTQHRFRRRNGMRRKFIGGDRLLWRH